ncbi:hypothetical protein LOC68_19555 [Blastopirellula sp. JC732]|uniref:Uncharacterized protein n=1 Tax=Blastopirellula sediminis TaxID=2894196 RepID=A0A9X1SI95_9BACT|nr:hypothetical protein [Blastopirellula sediminis]MCC9606105.1 hypothetical protein [Blastopirellula sediminis]MCC9630596.1 hypothetical protein [Blastopirellula sediminis]
MSMIRLFSVALLVVTLASAVRADDKVITSEKAQAHQCVCRACYVNFTKEFGVPLEFLGSLGHSIHDARLAPDPAGLAICSRSLAVAEQVSGKKASVTSDEVMSDAIRLAKLRGVSTELEAVKLMVSDDAVKKELTEAIEDAKVREEEAKQDAEAIAKGEQTKQLFGRLTVYNQCGECVRVYAGGRYLGVVHEGQAACFHVHNHDYHTELEAYCVEEGHLVSADCSEGHRHSYTWYIR